MVLRPRYFYLFLSSIQTINITPSQSFHPTILFLSNHQQATTTTTYRNTSFQMTSSSSSSSNNNNSIQIDREYPGTSMERLRNVHQRIASIAKTNALNQDWEDVRRQLLWAGGLRDLPNAIPGQGYTGHAFNDYNHVDLTTMSDGVSDSENDGKIKGIARGNLLGPGIRIASLPELGPGGSWSTCANNCHLDPPQDVAHIQFQSRIAFKLVWVPNEQYNQFVLVDDDGIELARGAPTGNLPPISQRRMNYGLVQGSKYSKVADEIAKSS